MTEEGDYLITEYISAEGERYGLLLDEKFQTLAYLPNLCDVKSLEFTSYAKGNEETSIDDRRILSEEVQGEFEINENGVLTAYHGDGGDVVLPEGITEIGWSAFEGCSKLTSVIIPEEVTTIGESAFRNCSSLTSVTIPEGVTEIREYAFNGCSSLVSVIIPEGVEEIGSDAFRDCSSLTSIIIPEGVKEIGGNAFKDCSNLASITIPKGVTKIGTEAFSSCSNLKSLTIPEGITTIGDSVFENCSSLVSVIIPKGVTTIGWRAFKNCSSLTNVTIPKGVTTIEGYAFSDCSSLKSLTIPESVTAISYDAFQDCSLTIYCYADSYKETYAKKNNIPYKLIGVVENPYITTTDIPEAVQYVPYSVIIENNNQDSENKVRYSLKEGSLPDGMELKENGELYGVPKEVGEFTFTVIMENSSDFPSSEKTYTLVVMKNTDETVDSSIDQGYNLIERVPDIDLNVVESQTLVSRGEFRGVYLDGTKLIRDEDYVAEEGSTKITIRSQTLTRVGKKTHTIALEFETNTGLKRVTQNYTVSNRNDNNNNNNNNSENGSNQDKDDINNGSDNNNNSNNNNSSNNNSGSEDNSESNNQDKSNNNSSDNENEVEDDILNIYSEDLWVKDRVGWRYKKPNGAWLLHIWCKLPYKGTNEWYYFNERGYMVTG